MKASSSSNAKLPGSCPKLPAPVLATPTVVNAACIRVLYGTSLLLLLTYLHFAGVLLPDFDNLASMLGGLSEGIRTTAGLTNRLTAAQPIAICNQSESRIRTSKVGPEAMDAMQGSGSSVDASVLNKTSAAEAKGVPRSIQGSEARIAGVAGLSYVGISAQDLSLTRARDTVSGIPGSKIKSKEEMMLFRLKWDCVASQKGQWVHDPIPRPMPWPASDPCKRTPRKDAKKNLELNRKAATGKLKPEEWAISDNLKFIWEAVPKAVCGVGTQLNPFNASLFCDALRAACNRSGSNSVYIVGDSITRHFDNSILDQLRMSGIPAFSWHKTAACSQHLRTCPIREISCHTNLVCGKSVDTGGVLVHFAFSSFLQSCAPKGEDPLHLWVGSGMQGGRGANMKHAANKRWVDAREYLWMDEAELLQPAIVILNRGPHFVPTSSFLPQLSFCFREIRRRLPNTLLVYRSTAAGHPNCTSYVSPLRTPPVATSPTGQGWHWEDFQAQNEIARRLVEDVGGVYLDVYLMSLLRPDRHRGTYKRRDGAVIHDCLHWCAPGPADAWVQLFACMLHDLVL